MFIPQIAFVFGCGWRLSPLFGVRDLSFDILDGKLVVENLNLFDMTLFSTEGSIGGCVIACQGMFCTR